ncbi:MAG: hypothetical protein CMO01_20595 [Thalassobius sp.]|nr:hypothetical protein [Thalassovita sp.]
MKKGFFVLRQSDEMCPPGSTFSSQSYYCDQCPYRSLDHDEYEEYDDYEDTYWEDENDNNAVAGAAMWYYATRDNLHESTNFEPFDEADYSAVEATGEVSFDDEGDDDSFLDS